MRLAPNVARSDKKSVPTSPSQRTASLECILPSQHLLPRLTTAHQFVAIVGPRTSAVWVLETTLFSQPGGTCMNTSVVMLSHIAKFKRPKLCSSLISGLEIVSTGV